jgi:hypothetical protein
MMGTQNKQSSLFSYRINLEQRVRPDHPRHWPRFRATDNDQGWTSWKTKTQIKPTFWATHPGDFTSLNAWAWL